MSKQVEVKDAVEVLQDRGDGTPPRWTVGSGLLIGGTRVLTAAHNVGKGILSVRVNDGTEYAAMVAQVGGVEQGPDIAVLDITDPNFRKAPETIVQFAQLDRRKPDTIENCWAIGFPKFKVKEETSSGGSRLRDSIQIDGEIPLGSNVRSGMLEFQVKARPREEPSPRSSEWEGISGAVVFCDDPVYGIRAIGVIVEHYLAEGPSSLTVVPLTAISTKLDEPTALQWWELLDVKDPDKLPYLPLDPEKELEAAEARYREQVINKYQSLDFGGFTQRDLLLTNVPLEKIFVHLSMTVENVIREPVPSNPSNQKGQPENQQRERVVPVQEPIELGQALTKNLVIMGEPGAGKSMLLRWLAVTFAQGTQQEANRIGPSADVDRLPILVELGKLPSQYLKGGEMPKWTEYLHHYLLREDAFANIPPQMLTKALAKGRCLFLFDGLDEIADRQTRMHVARSLAELARLFSKNGPIQNRVVISSRPGGINESKPLLDQYFPHWCQIEHFTSEEIQQFFRFWYALDSELTTQQQRERADALYARVQATPAILQLATTPLLSTILLLIWRNKGDLPSRQVELYEQCCHALIEQWENAHKGDSQADFADLGEERYLRLLAQVAYLLHQEEKRTEIGEKELLVWLVRGLQTVGYCSDQATASWKARDFLKLLTLRSPLLRYRETVQEEKHYSFLHQTFQEYLAARYIAEQPYPEYIDLVLEHVHELWWREVHLLTIGYLGSGDEEREPKASRLILRILDLYKPPLWLLRVPQHKWLRRIAPGKFFHQAQLQQRVAWVLGREIELAAAGYGECASNGISTAAHKVLLTQITLLVERILSDESWFAPQRTRRSSDEDSFDPYQIVLPIMCESLRRHNNETIVNVLLEAFHSNDWKVRRRAEKILEQVGVGNQKVVHALLETFYSSPYTRSDTVELLGQVGVGNQRVVHALLQALHNGNSLVRTEAAISLGRVGVGNPRVVDALCEALYDRDERVRSRAALILGVVGVGNQKAVEALLKAFHDGKLGIRWYVAESLGRVGVGNQEVAHALRKALHSSSRHIRQQAAESLGRVGVSNEAVVDALCEALYDRDERVRSRAAKSLGQVGVGNQRAVDALLEALYDNDWDVYRQAAESLEQVGVGNQAAVEALLEDLHERDSQVRQKAAGILGRVSMGNQRVVEALLEALQDSDSDVRRQAAESLGWVGIGNQRVVDALLEALHDSDVFVPLGAAESLGRVGVGNQRVVEALLEALHDDGTVRRRAAELLGQVGVGNPRVVDALLEVLLDDDLVGQQAAKSLGLLGAGNKAVETLLEALYDDDWTVRRRAAELLGQVGAGNKAVVEALLKTLLDDAWPVSGEAAESLGRVGVGNQRVVDALLEALHDGSLFVRWYAAESLGRVGAGNQRVVEALLKALHDGDSQVRWYAAKSLVQVGVGNEAVVDVLRRALRDDDWSVRRQAAESLRQLGADNKGGVEALREALYKNDRQERKKAAESLGQLEIKDLNELRQVLIGLNHCLYDGDDDVRRIALISIQHLLDGRPIPGYQWVSLVKQ